MREDAEREGSMAAMRALREQRMSPQWARHWTLVLAACIGFSFMSKMTPAIGVFMAPLGEAFGGSKLALPGLPTTSGAITVRC